MGTLQGYARVGPRVGTGAGYAEKATLQEANQWGGPGKKAGGTRVAGPYLSPNELYRLAHI